MIKKLKNLIQTFNHLYKFCINKKVQKTKDNKTLLLINPMIRDSKQASQNLYIRKLNGLGEKISVRDTLKVGELKEMVRCLKSLEAVGLGNRDFNLIYKGRNITQKCQQTLRQLNIPSDGIIHLVFSTQQQKKSSPPAIKFTTPSSFLPTLSLRVIFNSSQHKFLTTPSSTVLDLKKSIAIKLNLVYQSLTLSHLGTEMIDDMQIREYKLESDTLISLRFNNAINPRVQMKKLQSRMVSSVTISDENSEPNNQHPSPNLISNQFHLNHKLTASSNSFQSDKEDNNNNNNNYGSSNNNRAVCVSRLSSMIMPSAKTNSNMYKSEITTFGKTEVVSKAALMFKNALHQKIIQTQSVVSGQFSQSASSSRGCDPNSLMITVKNQQQTKQFVFECLRTHQILDIKEKLLHIQKNITADGLEISLEEDLFQSIDLTKSGCVTLNQIVKKLGSERAVFVYRVV